MADDELRAAERAWAASPHDRAAEEAFRRAWERAGTPPRGEAARSDARVQQVDVERGEGLLVVHQGGIDVAVRCAGEPIALVHADCRGSVGQIVLRANDPAALAPRVAAIRRFVDDSPDPERSLGAHLLPFLELFAPGRYEVRFEPEAEDWVLPWAEAVDSVYPDPHVLVETRRRETLDAARVAHFVRRIEAGYRPLVLATTAPEAWASLVVDGHHKLAAYERANVRPSVVEVMALTPAPLTVAEGRTFLATLPRAAIVEYVRLKRENDA